MDRYKKSLIWIFLEKDPNLQDLGNTRAAGSQVVVIEGTEAMRNLIGAVSNTQFGERVHGACS